MKPFYPKSPCPVCKARLNQMNPVRTELPGESDKPDGIVCLTICAKCKTLIEYDMINDVAAIMSQETIDSLEGTPLGMLFALASAK